MAAPTVSTNSCKRSASSTLVHPAKRQSIAGTASQGAVPGGQQCSASAVPACVIGVPGMPPPEGSARIKGPVIGVPSAMMAGYPPFAPPHPAMCMAMMQQQQMMMQQMSMACQMQQQQQQQHMASWMSPSHMYSPAGMVTPMQQNMYPYGSNPGMCSSMPYPGMCGSLPHPGMGQPFAASAAMSGASSFGHGTSSSLCMPDAPMGRCSTATTSELNTMPSSLQAAAFDQDCKLEVISGSAPRCFADTNSSNSSSLTGDEGAVLSDTDFASLIDSFLTTKDHTDQHSTVTAELDLSDLVADLDAEPPLGLLLDTDAVQDLMMVAAATATATASCGGTAAAAAAMPL